MLNDACTHAMSRLNACLTPRVLQPFPPKRNLIPRLHDLPFLVETRINLTKIVLTFPCSVLFTMIIPNHLVELDDFAMSHSFHFFKHYNRSFFIGQIQLNLDTSGFNSFFRHTKTFLELGDMKTLNIAFIFGGNWSF